MRKVLILLLSLALPSGLAAAAPEKLRDGEIAYGTSSGGETSYKTDGVAPDKITVSGHVYDASTGETLIGAGVVFPDAATLTGAATNNFGYYSLTLTSKIADGRDKIALSYSYIGYQTQTVTVPFLRDTVINVTLTPSLGLAESVVTARRDAGLKSSYLGAIDVPLEHIRCCPTAKMPNEMPQICQTECHKFAKRLAQFN